MRNAQGGGARAELAGLRVLRAGVSYAALMSAGVGVVCCLGGGMGAGRAPL